MLTEDPTPNRAHLADVVQHVRRAQGQTQAEAAHRGGITSVTWSGVELARSLPKSKTLAALDTGLGWPRGTAERVLHGGDPPPATDELADTTANDGAATLGRIENQLAALSSRVEANGRRLDSLAHLIEAATALLRENNDHG